MVMSFKSSIRRFFRGCGYDFMRFSPSCHPLAQQKKLLASYCIDTILDVGANTGQFARQLRKDLAYKGRIVSFEPINAAFRELEKNASGDPDWSVFNCAMGDSLDEIEINIAGNSTSSSCLDMLSAHLDAAPASGYVGKELVSVKTVDSIFDEICGPSDKICLKIDTQGFEEKVIKGALGSLPRIKLIQMEMSLVPLYRDEMTFDQMYNYMVGLGFMLIGVEPGFADIKSGRLLQLDGIFENVRA